MWMIRATVQRMTNYNHQLLIQWGKKTFSVASTPSLLQPPRPLPPIADGGCHKGVTFLLIFPSHPLQWMVLVAIAPEEEHGRGMLSVILTAPLLWHDRKQQLQPGMQLHNRR